jgi:hypothetical protein
MSDKKMALSKTRYCKGIQCPKILWLDMNKPDKAVEIKKESVPEKGKQLREIARAYFGECKQIDFDDDIQAKINQTKELMAAGAMNIAGGAYSVDGLYGIVDILRKNGDGWDAAWMNSSTSVSETDIDGMAFQYYVMKRCGINVKHVYNIHINNSYEFHSKHDVHSLYLLEDCTAVCEKKYVDVEKNISYIMEYMDEPEEPTKDIDICCEKPYECAYKKYCWRHIPENSIFDVKGLRSDKKFEYYHNGIITYEDIVLKRAHLSNRQMKQVETAYYHLSEYIDKEKIKDFLDMLNYPIYYLDFETFQTPIPELEGCKPYEQIPFQYSIHIEYEDGTLEHREFLAQEGSDMRRDLAESLCNDIPKDACVLAYNMSFERGVIQGLGQFHPDRKEHLFNIRENIHDLMTPFQKQYYYTEAMQGSYSIKYVLPALFPNVPELDYNNLDQVHNGEEASAAFAGLKDRTADETEQIRSNLLKYCCLDTYAMVKILSKLKEKVQND